MLAILAKILKVLNSEQSPRQIAAAISLAAIVGLTPLLSLHNLIILLLVLWLRVNLTMFLVAWPLFTVLGLALTPLSESVGSSLLQAESLVPMWDSFYNTLVGRWSNFYYTGVIGSLAIAVVLAIVLFPLSQLLISNYRSKWLERFEQYHIVKMLKASKLWQLYESHSS